MRFFSSDGHWGHNNILRYCPDRPWKTVEEMNEGLINNWNSVVTQDDVVYYIGDFSMAFRPVETITKRLLGEKHLLVGNHDWAHPLHKKSRTPGGRQQWIDKYLEAGWDSVLVETELLLQNGVKARLNHLPYLEEGGDEDQRHAKWRPVDDGTLLLCGHVHQNWLMRSTKKGTPMINVGVDCNPHFRPWSEDEICNMIHAVPE